MKMMYRLLLLLTILDIIFDIIQRKYSLDDYNGYLRQWVKDRVRLNTALAENWNLLNLRLFYGEIVFFFFKMV